eukprot:139275_1
MSHNLQQVELTLHKTETDNITTGSVQSIISHSHSDSHSIDFSYHSDNSDSSDYEANNSIATNPKNWHFDQVQIWLTSKGLSSFIPIFEKDNHGHGVDGHTLLALNRDILMNQHPFDLSCRPIYHYNDQVEYNEEEKKKLISHLVTELTKLQATNEDVILEEKSLDYADINEMQRRIAVFTQKWEAILWVQQYKKAFNEIPSKNQIAHEFNVSPVISALYHEAYKNIEEEKRNDLKDLFMNFNVYGDCVVWWCILISTLKYSQSSSIWLILERVAELTPTNVSICLLSHYEYELSKFDETNIHHLTRIIVIASKYPVCTALRIAKWYNDRSNAEVARSDLFAKTAQEFVQMAIYYTNIITSDHLLTILLEVKSDIDNKSAFDMALEYGLTSFVANNRIETISTSIMNTYKFLKPCNIEDAFHIDALSVKLIWKHVQKPCFFFTPLGTYLSSAVSYLVFILIYTYLSSYQFDIHNTITTQELFFWILNIGYILHEMQMFVVDGLKLYFSQYSNFFDTLISCIFVSRLVIRLYSMFKSIDCKQNELCWSASNLNGIYVILWGISTILLWCGSINFFVLSPRLGPLIQMIYEMMDDIIAFFEIMIILASGFLVCLTFMFADIYAEFEGGIQSGVSLFRAILGDFNLDIFFGEENET